MSGDDTDITSFKLDHLHLARRPTGEGEKLLAQTCQTEGIIRRLKDGKFLRRDGEGKDVDAIQQDHDNAGPGETHSEDRRPEVQRDDHFLLGIVPDDQLEEGRLVDYM